MSSASLNTINVWSNDFEHNSFKAFYSALKLENEAHWSQVDSPESASLWCLVEIEENSEALTNIYQSLNKPPLVLYLAKSFTVAPVSSWVFFRSPVNVTTLHKWLKSKFIDILATQPNQGETGSPKSSQPLWKTQEFKLKYWPNITDYSDDLSVVNACSVMLRNWVTYDSITSLVDGNVLSKMLMDMDKQSGIEYQPQQATSTNNNQTSDITESDKESVVLNNESDNNKSGMGFFKKLFNRYKS